MYLEILETEYGNLIVPSTDINQVQYYKNNKVYIDQNQIDLLSSVMKPIDSPVIVDCGTNVGFFAFGLNKLLSNATIYCFEAQKEIFKMLKGTIALNEFSNIQVFHNVISSDINQDYSVPVYNFNITSNFGSVEVQGARSAVIPGESNFEFIGQATARYEMVKSKTIDSLNLERLDLLKLDIEGMEERAISGAINTIKTCRPILFIEYIKSNRNNLINMVTELKYDIVDVVNNYVCYPKAIT